MKARFFELAERLGRVLKAGEMLLCEFSGERSDFVRFNRGKVRQAGSVEQGVPPLRLRASGARHGNARARSRRFDASRMALDQLARLCRRLARGSLFSSTKPRARAQPSVAARAVSADAVAQEVVGKAQGRDLVGIYAGGTICRGFANSLGQRNWHEVDSFNFDWSLYLEGDKAVKTGYAGFEWSQEAFAGKLHAPPISSNTWKGRGEPSSRVNTASTLRRGRSRR